MNPVEPEKQVKLLCQQKGFKLTVAVVGDQWRNTAKPEF
jgi:hypothetical protein